LSKPQKERLPQEVRGAARSVDKPLCSDYGQAHFGRIDVLINNAGVDFLGAVQEHLAFS